MPNLDAEVLNEPKKQIVKDFNKEEIVQIIQNAIDKGIINLGDIGGSEVVANPTLEGTESNLEGLEVDGEKYKIPEGTVVEANPTLAGTEDALTGLQVGDTKYAVGGGGTKLYRHNFSSREFTPYIYTIDLVNNTVTQTTGVKTSSTLSIISTRDTAYTSLNSVWNDTKDSKILVIKWTKGYEELHAHFVSYGSLKFRQVEYDTTNNTVTITEWTMGSSLGTDTVTEL